MKKIGLKSLSDDAREVLRRSAIRMLKNGQTQKQVADNLGCSHRAITLWWSDYKELGTKSFRYKVRGRRLGEKRTLSTDQEKQIQKLITDRCPDQLKLPYALWTRKAVRELIMSQYGIDVAIRTVGDYLKRWGFTPQKPIRRAYEQKPELVQKWLKEQYPTIKEQAKKENADIQWCDETGFSSEDNRGRGYSPKGKTPVAYGPGSRFSASMISSIDNMGKLRWMVYKGAMNIDLFISFMKRIIKDSKRKVYLIVDNLKVHHANKVKEWVGEHKSEIELFFLPPYSPEYNPDEYVNNDVKTNLRSRLAPRSDKELQRNVRSYMRKLQRNGEKVKRFFLNENTRYASAG